MPSKLLSQLAKHTQAQVNAVTYGHMRGKLSKKGFSEIAMYAAVARHCEENDIPPFDMAKDMLKLVKGCSEHEFFIRINDEFPYLRRQFNEIRHGDVDKGEMKSPEQRGQFLCNTCHLVKSAGEKAGKNYCCKICTKERAYATRTKSQKDNPTPPAKPPVQPPVVKPAPKPEVTPAPISKPTGVDIDALSPKKDLTPPPATPEPNKVEPTDLIKDSDELFLINQIIGDENATEISIVCPTQNLPSVLGILKELQK